ncbi:MAG TPA: hypothetical protein VLV16_04375 [Gemmatimonadales bacterium]|nr:hypothetical protein [Gemmatimonadales bacterium]
MCRLTFLALGAIAFLGIAACTDRPPTAVDADQVLVPTAGGPASPVEELARTLAMGLRSPVLRAYLRAQIRTSPYREQKVQFQRFLDAGGEHALRALVAATHGSAATVAQSAHAAAPLELYLPVPAHRVAWMGEGRVLVATAMEDGDPPVAFDTAGRRYVLSPYTPPAVPVLALVPVETDFAAPPPPDAMMCLDACGGGGGGGIGKSPTPPTGLYMTQSHFTQKFEGWLKGAPEFEVHILGQKGQTDSLADYQCAAEHQPAPYYFDQNDLDWTGNVLLFSQAQLDAYRAAHPGQNVRVFVVEDDDAACTIKTDNPGFLALLDQLNGGRTAGKDTTANGTKGFVAAVALQKLLALVASVINTNDELVGNAVADSVAGEAYPGFNWIVKGADNATNGWIKLEMR